MASTKRTRVPSAHIPLSDDEEDVVEQARAEEDENGNLVTTQADLKRVGGAMDAESVRENRRRREAVKKRRSGERVSFGSDDVTINYDEMLQTMLPGDIEIRQKRLTGSQITYLIKSQPRSGAELYEAFMQNHMESGGAEAEYKIVFINAKTKSIITSGRFTLPDKRPLHLREQPPMAYQPPYAPPPGYPPQYGAPPQQPPPQQIAPPPPPAAPQDRLAEFNAMRDFMTSIGWGPPGQQVAPPQPQMPPGVDVAHMREMAALFTSMGWHPPTQQAPAPQPVPQQPTYASAPSPMQPPPYEPYPGTEWVYKPERGWIQQQLQRSSSPFQRRPQQYDPNEERSFGPHAPPQYRPPPPGQSQPQRERSATDMFRESLANVRQFKTMASEIQSVFGGGGGGEDREPQEQETEDEGPLRTKKFGDVDAIVDDESGGIAWGATLAINFPKGLKWLSEQVDKVKQEQQRQASGEESQPPPQQQQPFPGQRVNVQPGQQPPQGWKFVPEEEPQRESWPQQQRAAQAPQQGLRPPPAQVPPQIQDVEPPPPGQIAWGPPEGGG